MRVSGNRGAPFLKVREPGAGGGKKNVWGIASNGCTRIVSVRFGKNSDSGTVKMKTYIPKVNEIERGWVHFDAEDVVVGRLAVVIANRLRGRHRPDYTPHLDTGNFVIVTNCEKIKFTGDKWRKKIYQDYTGWMGGLKEKTARDIRDRRPERIIRDAVWGMLPHGRLGRAMFRKLKVYVGPVHPHAAQSPEELTIDS